MDRGALREKIQCLARDAMAAGGCLIVQGSDGSYDFVDADSVELSDHALDANGLDGTRIQIPLALIADVKLDLD